MLIWGFKSYVLVMAVANVVCGRCQNPAAHRLHRITRKFTLFFIPTFPVSRKYVLECTFCGTRTKLTKEQAEAFATQAQATVPAASPTTAPPVTAQPPTQPPAV